MPICFDGLKLSCDYFDRCGNLPDSTLVKKAFLEQKRLDLDWYHNLLIARSNYSIGTSKYISTNVSQNMRSNFIEKLFKSINESPKLEFYSTIKKQFKQEEYLNCSIYKYRTALTRLRISAHNFEIERGRYGANSTSRDQRFCRYCQEVLHSQVVESEKHVLDECPLYV